eukprot:XP_763635.1 hypothetical protein [Theileria parva strain Muguga]
MKQNSVLFITLNEFGLDLHKILDRLKEFEITNNEHILLRTLSELPITDYLINEETFLTFINNSFKRFFTNSTNQLYNATNTIGSHKVDNFVKENEIMNGLELTNYICSCCKLLYKNVINYSYLNKVEECVKKLDLSMFTLSQLVDLCYHLALIKSEFCKKIFARMNELEFFDKVSLSEVIFLFTKYIHFDDSNFFETVVDKITKTHFGSFDKLDGNSELGLSEYINLLAIVGFGRRYIPLIDLIVERLKGHELSLEEATKILINLSKVNYNNRSFIKQLLNSVLSSVDQDTILDPYLLSNLFKSYSRFSLLYGTHLNEDLYQVLLHILIKEEVLSDFKTHDLLTVFKSLCKLCNIGTTGSEGQPGQGINTMSRLSIRQCLNVIAREIFKRDINSDTSLRLIISSSKVPYNNHKLLNSLVENINLKGTNNLTQLYKLKEAIEMLSLHYPELNERILQLENNMDPKTPYRTEEESARDINVSVPRNSFYRIQSVKKRKWTY